MISWNKYHKIFIYTLCYKNKETKKKKKLHENQLSDKIEANVYAQHIKFLPAVMTSSVNVFSTVKTCRKHCENNLYQFVCNYHINVSCQIFYCAIEGFIVA